MKTQIRRDVLLFIASVLASAVAAAIFYRPFFEFFDFFFGPNIELDIIFGSSGKNIESIAAVFDIAYVLFLAFFLPLVFNWRKTLRFLAYGYLILIGLSIFVGGIYIPRSLRLLFILASASVGFLIGQGIRYAIFSITGWRHFAIDLESNRRDGDSEVARTLAFQLPTKREFGILAICAGASVLLAVSLHRQFFVGFDSFLGLFDGGFYAIDRPPYSATWLINATLGLSFPLALSFLLSLFLQLRKAAILWVVGYVAFVVVAAMFYNPLFIPDVYDIPQIVMFAFIGFIIGQGIRLAVTRLAKLK